MKTVDSKEVIRRPNLDEIMFDIRQEVERTTALHGDFTTAHECYGVLLEEVDEFWDIVKQKQRDRDFSALYTELVQVAAMAIKGLQSINKFVGGDR